MKTKIAWALCGWTVLVGGALASTTATFKVDGYGSLDEGEAKEAMIASDGMVRPGYATQSVALTEIGNTWAALTSSDGSVYLGTDKEATLFVVKDTSAKKVATLPGAVAIVALAKGPDGSLLAGTMPKGEIWNVSLSSGKTTKLAELKDVETVWSLAISKDGKTLYAGTGPEGELFEIDVKTGKSTSLFKSEDKRILALVVAQDGGVWFGTSEKALLFRYDPKTRRTRAMADFAGNEITAIAEHAGRVYVAANDIKDPIITGVKSKAAIDEAEGNGNKGQKAKMPDKGTKPGADPVTPVGTGPTRTGERKGKGALFRVLGDGQLEQVHALPQTYFTCLGADDAGNIYAGAGDKGRIYVVAPDDTVATAFDVKERQINQLLVRGNKVDFITMDATALYRTTGASQNASYVSKVFDATAPSAWGTLVWYGEYKQDVQTRSGYTEEPEFGWSEWAPLKTVARTAAGGVRGKIQSPAGRYLQFRTLLREDKTSFSAATVYYLPQNRATKVSEVQVTAGSASESKMLESSPEARSPVLKLKWKAENEDSDETVYELSVRKEGEIRWRTIPTGPKPLTTNSFDWNTETFPDGEYRLKVTAKDVRSNGSERALASSAQSRLFVVDNLKPVIDSVSVSYPNAAARAADSLSVVTGTAFSVDDGPWQTGAARDLIFDDTTEFLRVKLEPGLSPGVHTLALRAADSAGNIGSTVVTFTVK